MFLGVRHGQAAPPDQVSQRRRADATAQCADGGLAHQDWLGGTAGPRQTLGNDSEDLLVCRFRVQAQRHAVVDPGHGREAAHALAVAAVLVQHGMHDIGWHDPCQPAGREIVTQPSTGSQHRLGSRHTPARRRAVTTSILGQSNLTEQYCVRDNVLQLQIHLRHRFLHVHDVRRREVGMPLAQPQIDAQRGNVLPRPEAGAQQTASVEPLKPLRVVHIALAARDASGIAGVGDDDVNAMALEYLVHK